MSTDTMEYLQHFFQIDDSTSSFASAYFVVAAVLAGLSVLFHKKRPVAARQEKKKRARPPVIQAGIDFGMGFVRLVAKSGVTPNQITLIGLVLVAFNCVVFAFTANTFALGSGLIAALLFDALDGTVARAQGTASKFGAYLDAVVDRYQEVVIYLTLGLVLDLWLEAFLIITGSLLVSYTKARSAMEAKIDNKSWPDLTQRALRLFILCTGLIAAPVVPWVLPVALWMLVVMTYFTALQRIVRAASILS